MSFDNMSSMYYLHHPRGGGRLLEFNNNYFLSGHPAFRTIDTKSYPSHDAKTMAFSTILGGKIYTIGYVVVTERFPDYLQIAQTMIDSFQIINKQ